MPVEIYMSGKFGTSYEREALSVIATDLDTLFRDTSDLCIILANYRIQGGQVDITILKKDSIIVVELKDCSLPFTATENDIWQCPNGHIVGYKDSNPFQQVGRYRRKWKDFLGEQKSKFNCLKTIIGDKALWHVRFVVAISPSLHAEVKNDIDLNSNWWFRLIGSNELRRYVSFGTNKHFNFSDNELRSIPRLLSIPLVSLESVTGAKVRPQAPPPPPKIPQVSFEPVSRPPSPPPPPKVSFEPVSQPPSPPPPPKIPQVSLEPVIRPPSPPPPPKVSFEPVSQPQIPQVSLESVSQPPSPPPPPKIPQVSLEPVIRPPDPPPPPKIPQASFEPVSRPPDPPPPPKIPQVSLEPVSQPPSPPPPPKVSLEPVSQPPSPPPPPKVSLEPVSQPPDPPPPPKVSFEPVSQPPDPPPPPKVSFEPVSQPPDPPPPPKIPQVSFESVSGATVRSQAPRKPQFGIIVGIVAAIIDLFLVAWIITTLMPFISGTRNATLAGETPSIPPSTPFTTTAIPAAESADSSPEPFTTTAIPAAESADSSPEPSVAPAGSNSQPVFHGTGRDTTVEPSWYPCQEGQIKGNKNSKIYHISTGRSYNKTFREVTCFSTAAEAEAAGFRAAGN